MMKRYLSLMLVAALLLCMAACGAPAEAPAETTEATEAIEVTEAPETTEATEASDIPEETEAPAVRTPMNMELPEMETTPTEELEVPADALRTSMAEDTLIPNPMKSSSEPYDPYRPQYDVGTSKQLEGDVFTLLIFLDDYESSWTYDEANTFIQEKYFPAETWLCQQANGWGTSINFTSGYYGTDATMRIIYTGIVGDFNGNLNNDIMEQISACLGFMDKESMHQWMADYAGTDNIAYVVVLDKPGRSYAMMDCHNDGYEYVEYALLFAQPLYVGNLVYDCPPATVAHEMLHTFGAEDFYAEGTQRNGRARLASAYYPYGIMYQTYYEIDYNYVDHFTAYTVGWTDYAPDVCYNSDWWN